MVNPTKWPITGDEENKNVPDSLLPASASSVEVLPTTTSTPSLDSTNQISKSTTTTTATAPAATPVQTAPVVEVSKAYSDTVVVIFNLFF